MFEQLQPFLMLGASNVFLNKDDQNIYSSIFKALLMLIGMKIYQITNSFDIETKISDYIKDFFNKENTIVIKFCSHDINIKCNGTTTSKKTFSDTFCAINYFVKMNIKNIKGIINHQEILTNAVTNDWNSEKNRFAIIPLQNQEFVLDTISKIPIYCKMNKKNNPEPSEDSKNSSSKTVEIYIELYCYLNKNKSNTKIIEETLFNFIKKCENEYNESISPKDKSLQYIYAYDKSITSDEGYSEIKFKEYLFESNKDLDKNVFFEGKDKLIHYITPFISNKNETENLGELLYSKLGKTYSAGILLSGPPGCGKSSTIKAILKYTKRQGILINLSSIKSNEELEMLFRNRLFNRKIYKGTEIAFIIEDCDADQDEALLDRSIKNDQHKLINESLKKKTDSNNMKDSELMPYLPMLFKPTFDLNCFLNILDGIIELHGVMVIMTTNYKEKLDKALIRDGRIDFKFEFKKASKQVIKDILKLKFDVDDSSFDKNVKFNEIKDYILSPATIQSISFKSSTLDECISQILQESQDSKNK